MASTATLNKAADAVTPDLVYMSVHTADPSTTGASEATGGSPAYARKLVTWAAAVAGTATGAQVTFDLPAGTYTHGGYWSAATGGTWLWGKPLGASQTLAAQGQVKVTPTVPVTTA